MSSLETFAAASGAIEISFLTQIGPDPLNPNPERDAQIAAVATKIADFINGAKATLDLAIYDFRLHDAPAAVLTAAIRAAAQRGVAVRIAYDAATSGGSVDAPGPALPDPQRDHAEAKTPGADNFVGTFKDVAQIKPIKAYQALMHNKYIIRDGASSEAAVFMGTANFTNDSWGLQENNILTLRSQPLSTYYTVDFNDLWVRGKIADSTGYHDTGTVTIGDTEVTVVFTPGESKAVVKEIVGVIAGAKSSLAVASVVLSSAPILAALSEALDRGVPFSGIYDGPQMDQVIRQWQAAGIGADRIAAWQKISKAMARKDSIPFSAANPGQPHNFMHNKLVVADDCVVTGSFNLSHHAMMNAENTLLIRNSAIAERYRAYLAKIVAMYRK
ncbi:phospholipase D-like domain-containing protein [Methylovirgula sp. 4M-Z18]|uniref:phospholipase D-like domain-containing protein n=1 Tax=Methylovirgula sp. 4M-Z18 TaxID=2293567 RepID=UPI000E3812E2|nr:phosphatidylserine/phosphatidylglycerophosphate/cardiolipin synthase family protein [Methylovirgula sp. 4M-Z18]RFB77960.1 phosphatidylserine/phosphatidylglycerophosphate/cardiolipin synthase family protein [Methylovirgula sp. 4M-Z18]